MLATFTASTTTNLDGGRVDQGFNSEPFTPETLPLEAGAGRAQTTAELRQAKPSSLEQDGYIPCPETVEQLRRALLAYCERDTLARVEVYRTLVRIAGESNGQASIQASTGASSPIAEPLPATAAETRLDEVTRLEVIDANGRSYVNWAAEKVTLLVQDEGQTLKVFCKGRNGAAPLLPTSPDPSE